MKTVTTRVASCSCAHPGQDALYGSSLRVFNKRMGKSGSDMWRCTVCKKERSLSDG